MQLPYRKPGKYALLKQDPLLTQEKFEELERKLKTLKARRPELAKEVARLAELGDFSENVEYQLAKGKLRGLNEKMLRLEYQLNHAEIIPKDKKSDTVQIGSTVTVLSQGIEKSYNILGSTETDPANGIISYASPLGETLMGKKVGDVVKRKESEYTILKIE